MARLVSCSRCGRVHELGKCSKKRKTYGRTQEQIFRSKQAWQDTAELVRERDRNMCQACLHATPPRFVTQNLQVHHIVPLKADPTRGLDMDNCITLCKGCHEDAESGVIPAATLYAWIKTNE